MEKNRNRNVHSSSRGLTTDSKKNADVSSKACPRGSRRRESAGASLSTKNEASRKPPPQRAKPFDKRPKPRGAYHTGAPVARNEAPRLEHQEAELGSVFLPGSKKQSLNHLLNFSYSPRESLPDNRGQVKCQTNRLMATKKHKYNKEHFLQANCQFIVQESGDYKQYVNNPDALVDWNLIEQVNVQVSNYPACPICLYPPSAAKMTRCGHIYCWSCILHYLALSDKTWRKCPICYESVHKKDLKSVVAVPHHTFNVFETITFKLMKRPRGSLIAYPIDQDIKNEGTMFNMLEKNVDNIYSKLLIASKENIMSIIERERIELESQLKEDENKPEKCFIEEAIALLKERDDKVLECLDSVKKVDVLEHTADLEILDPSNVDLGILEQHFDDLGKLEESKVDLETLGQTNVDVVTLNQSNVNVEALNQSNVDLESLNQFRDQSAIETVTSENLENELVLEDLENMCIDEADLSKSIELEPSGNNTGKFYYFYQASDGQHIYLHAINARMLEHTYGSLEFGPKTITGKILEKEGGSMTEDLRKRLRCLQHLPVTCQFEVAEVQLRHPVVRRDTLEYFSDQIEIRKKRRQRRAKEEKRREKKIAEEDNRLMGKYPIPNIHLESPVQFPEFGFDRPRTESEGTLGTPSELDSVDFATPSSSLTNENAYSGLSFATMLASEKKIAPSWPGLKSQPANPAFAPKLIQVTGAQMKTTQRVRKNSSDADDFEPVPSFNASFGDAIAQALQKAETHEEEAPTFDKKKKKKNKQKVLFTTNMAIFGKQ